MFAVPYDVGKFSVSDPGLVWNILYDYFNVIKLPLSGSVPLPSGMDYSRLNIAFGCETQSGHGYSMQIERDIEETFRFDSAETLYTGKAAGREYIEVASRSEKTEKKT